MTALVSAVIPTYNRAEYIGGAIECVLSQTYDDVEVVVVDDGSTDDTREVLAEYEGDDRVRVLHNEENRGIPYTANRALDAAEGNYIASIDDDDRWHPTKLEKQMTVFDQLDDSYCGVYTGGVIRDSDGNVLQRVMSHDAGDVYPDVLVRNTILPHSGHLVRAECFEAVGGFDEAFPIACDWDITIRLARQFKWAFIPETLVERTHHGSNVTGDPDYDVRCRRQVWEKFRADIARHPDVERRFHAAWARERGVRALEAGDRAESVTELAEAFSLEPRGDHAALLGLAPFGPRALSTARKVRDRLGSLGVP
jgi:glycosyltransferase involved in cell wall biosynthesis